MHKFNNELSNFYLQDAYQHKKYRRKLNLCSSRFGRAVTQRIAFQSGSLLKRGLDIFAALAGLIILSPIFLIVAILIKAESKGPIFFKQERVGKFGRKFMMYKFRSMFVNATQMRDALANENEMTGGVIFKMKQDPRITKVGCFIRRSSIDELPQLINVLKGDMSIGGPRPALQSEVDLYSLKDRRRLMITPGITCLWQVNGRSEIPFDEQVKLDLAYMESQNFWEDMKIIAKTIPAILSGKGAF